LSADEACSFGNGLTANGDISTTTYLRSKYLAVGTTQNTYLSVITGKIDLGYKQSATTTETNIIGDEINIGGSNTSTTINIGVGKALQTTTKNN
jgi:hypothetical protein